MPLSILFYFGRKIMNETVIKKSPLKERLSVFLTYCRGLGQKRPVQALLWLSLLLLPLFCLFVLDFFNYYSYALPTQHLDKLLSCWQERPQAFWFGLLVLAGLLLLLVLLSRRVWVASGIFTLISLIFALVNYMKFALNGDNFMPQDFLMLRTASGLVSFISGSVPAWFFLALLVCVLWVGVYFLFGLALPTGWKINLPLAGAFVAVILGLFGTPAKAETILNNTFGMYFEDTGLQASNYYSNGFVGGFVLNLYILHETPPTGYSKATIDSLLSDYEETPATGEDFDVIVVLSESFADIRNLPTVSFSENPLSNYDELLRRENCYSGVMGTTALGGGTVRPEFEVLTGLSSDFLLSGPSPWDKVTSPISSYVSNYKEAGYHTIALHPYLKKFYARDRAYGNVGFDEFYALDELEEQFELSYKRGYVSDQSTLEAMTYYLDAAEEPTFLFAITMQSHQPYDALSPEELIIDVSSPLLGEEALVPLATYTQCLYDADQMLGALADYIDQRERPTILFFFGDHYPTLGSNYEVYNKTGFVNSIDGFDEEERRKLYTTPFIIYSNRDIDIPMFEEHTDNEISSFNALNAVAQATDFHRTPYMNWLLDFYAETPIYNNRLWVELSDRGEDYVSALHLFTYDRICGSKYSK